CFIEIHPEDASRLNITEGNEVEVTSRRGTICLPARFTENLQVGTVFMPIHYGNALGIGEEKLANILTHTEYDIHSKQPEYKFTAVNITRTVSS
ncbi:MAG: nitrate reductase catalytic subunit, partial [Candidatus Thorarchaeota archaeon]|nr:nitrate reductase catalytic subunit [Candidatus Thorarchaeota archaeon]